MKKLIMVLALCVGDGAVVAPSAEKWLAAGVGATTGFSIATGSLYRAYKKAGKKAALHPTPKNLRRLRRCKAFYRVALGLAGGAGTATAAGGLAHWYKSRSAVAREVPKSQRVGSQPEPQVHPGPVLPREELANHRGGAGGPAVRQAPAAPSIVAALDYDPRGIRPIFAHDERPPQPLIPRPSGAARAEPAGEALLAHAELCASVHGHSVNISEDGVAHQLYESLLPMAVPIPIALREHSFKYCFEVVHERIMPQSFFVVLTADAKAYAYTKEGVPVRVRSQPGTAAAPLRLTIVCPFGFYYESKFNHGMQSQLVFSMYMQAVGCGREMDRMLETFTSPIEFANAHCYGYCARALAERAGQNITSGIFVDEHGRTPFEIILQSNCPDQQKKQHLDYWLKFFGRETANTQYGLGINLLKAAIDSNSDGFVAAVVKLYPRAAVENNIDGVAPLVYAIQKKKNLALKALLEAPGITDFLFMGGHAESALTLAITRQNFEFVRLLLAYPDLDVFFHNGREQATPLILATQRANQDIFKLLFDRYVGKDEWLNHADRYGATALVYALGLPRIEEQYGVRECDIASVYPNASYANALIAAGASLPSRQDVAPNSLPAKVYQRCAMSLLRSPDFGEEEKKLFFTLLDRECLPLETFLDGKCLLGLAIEQGKDECVQRLLEAGFIFSQDGRGWRALTEAEIANLRPVPGRVVLLPAGGVGGGAGRPAPGGPLPDYNPYQVRRIFGPEEQVPEPITMPMRREYSRSLSEIGQDKRVRTGLILPMKTLVGTTVFWDMQPPSPSGFIPVFAPYEVPLPLEVSEYPFKRAYMYISMGIRKYLLVGEREMYTWNASSKDFFENDLVCNSLIILIVGLESTLFNMELQLNTGSIDSREFVRRWQSSNCYGDLSLTVGEARVQQALNERYKPIQFAITHCYGYCARALAQRAGQDISGVFTDEDGFTPFEIALRWGKKEHLDYWIKFFTPEANTNYHFVQITEAIDHAAPPLDGPSLLKSAIKSNSGLFVAIVLTMADPQSLMNQKPLLHAIELGSARAVEALVAQESPVRDVINQLGSKGETPIAVAVAHQNAEIVRILLVAGADPFRVDADKSTPLMLAACNDDRDIFELLLARYRGRRDALNQRDARGASALLYALGLHFKRPGWSHAKSIDEASGACLYGRPDAVYAKALIEAGAELVPVATQTPLEKEVYNRCARNILEEVEFSDDLSQLFCSLVDHDCLDRETRIEGMSWLCYALALGRQECAAALRDAGFLFADSADDPLHPLNDQEYLDLLQAGREAMAGTVV